MGVVRTRDASITHGSSRMTIGTTQPVCLALTLSSEDQPRNPNKRHRTMNSIKVLLLSAALCSTACGVSSSEGTDEPDTDVSTPTCSSFDETSCAQQMGCIPIVGRAYNESEMCLNAETFIICWEEDDAICGDTITAAIEAPNGACWFQSSICKPASWPQLTDENWVCGDVLYTNTTDCP